MDASKYVSVLLLSLRAMLHLELPHINVLSKMDLITQYGDLGTSTLDRPLDSRLYSFADFNLEYYTEVQDLSYLENALSASLPPKFVALNTSLISLIEDFSLVGFETLAVEDKHSMLHLTRAIDRATGYVFVPPQNATQPQPSAAQLPTPAVERPNGYALQSSAMSIIRGPRSDVRDVQERWIDAREEWDAHERKQWRREGEIAREMAKEAAVKRVTENPNA